MRSFAGRAAGTGGSRRDRRAAARRRRRGAGVRQAGDQGPGRDHGRARHRAGGRDPGDLHAAGGPELLRCRRPRHWPGRDVRRPPSSARTRRAGRAVRRDRHRPAGAAIPARHRGLVVRVAGRQAGCVRQRPAELVGTGRHDRAGGAVPGVAREPAQVRPHRQPGRQEDARADRARGQVRAGSAGRRLAHRRHRGPADHPAGPVRAGRRHRHRQPGRADRRGRAARRPAGARGRPGGHRLERRRGRRTGGRRVRRGRADRAYHDRRGPALPAGDPAARGRRGRAGGHWPRSLRGGIPPRPGVGRRRPRSRGSAGAGRADGRCRPGPGRPQRPPAGSACRGAPRPARGGPAAAR